MNSPSNTRWNLRGRAPTQAGSTNAPQASNSGAFIGTSSRLDDDAPPAPATTGNSPFDTAPAEETAHDEDQENVPPPLSPPAPPQSVSSFNNGDDERTSNPSSSDTPPEAPTLLDLIRLLAKNDKERNEIERARLERELVRDAQAGRTSATPVDHGASSKGPPLAVPKDFSGSHRSGQQLREFLSCCYKNFSLRPDRFRTERQKVLHAAAYLTGAADAWLEEGLLAPEAQKPSYFDNFKDFAEELQKRFGDPSELETAKQGMRHTRMIDSGEASHYTVTFNKHAAVLKRHGWSEESLMDQFKDGLPARLTQQIAASRLSFETMADLQNWVVESDVAWKAASLRAYESLYPSSVATAPPSPPSDTAATAKREDVPANKVEEAEEAESSTIEDRKPALAQSVFQAKLTSVEYQRRRDEDLCLYCGSGEHKILTCPTRPTKSFRGTRESSATNASPRRSRRG